MKITVIGAANIDIITKSKGKIISGERNPAEVSLAAGGAARNIAAMLTLNDRKVNLIAAVGNDPLGSLLRKNCRDLGINTDSWIIKNNTSTGVYVATLKNDGEMHAAFSATSAPESIRISDIAKYKEQIRETDLLILELSLTERIIGAILDIRGDKPVIIDAVSVAKAPRIENLLEKVDILKLNRLEAECLTGITLETKERVKQACYNIIGRGVNRVFITLGMAGVCVADQKYKAIFVPAMPLVVKNVTGAGEAFTAGLALSYDHDMRTQAESGLALAAEHLTRNM